MTDSGASPYAPRIARLTDYPGGVERTRQVYRGILARTAPDGAYTARGIGLDESWRTSFEAFLQHVGEHPNAVNPDLPETMQLDRIDNNQGYRPWNVRWATPTENARNKGSADLRIREGDRPESLARFLYLKSGWCPTCAGSSMDGCDHMTRPSMKLNPGPNYFFDGSSLGGVVMARFEGYRPCPVPNRHGEPRCILPHAIIDNRVFVTDDEIRRVAAITRPNTEQEQASIDADHFERRMIDASVESFPTIPEIRKALIAQLRKIGSNFEPSLMTVRRYCDKGVTHAGERHLMPIYKNVGRSVLYREHVVENWIDEVAPIIDNDGRGRHGKQSEARRR